MKLRTSCGSLFLFGERNDVVIGGYITEERLSEVRFVSDFLKTTTLWVVKSWGVRKISPLEIREKLGETRPCPLSSERIPKSISVKLKPEIPPNLKGHF